MKRLSTIQENQLTEVVCQCADLIGLDTNSDETYQDIEDLVGELLEALYDKAEEQQDVSSKIDLELTKLADDVIELTYDGGGDYISAPIREHKQALLTIILEALPEKQRGSWCCHPDEDDWHHIAPGSELRGSLQSDCKLHEFAGGSTGDASFNAALDEVKEALTGVFGAEV